MAALLFSLPSQSEEQLPPIEVLTTTPLPGLGLPREQVPSNVRTITIDNPQAASFPDLLEQSGTHLGLSAGQGNGFQPDLLLRGFVASPVLGVPQGLSVFQDGVRLNESFGDAVNWDLVSPGAIAAVEILPSGDAIFGPNTLGGAVLLRTRDGFSNRGSAATLLGGSWNRSSLELTHGQNDGSAHLFFTVNKVEEDGWALHNPSSLTRFFGKSGWRDRQGQVDISLTLADNRLQGLQTVPVSLSPWSGQPYTWPDANRNQLAMLAVQTSWAKGSDTVLDFNGWLRKLQSSNASSNVNNHAGQPDPLTGLPDTVQATNDLSVLDQRSAGVSLQLTKTGQLLARDNQLSIGASLQAGLADFNQSSQDAAFNALRTAISTGPARTVTLAGTRSQALGLWGSNAWQVSSSMTLLASLRADVSQLSIADLSGQDPALAGSQRFRRLTPALGLAWHPRPRLSSWISWKEGTRMPTAMEVTCADPNAPCRLPNAFLSDPPLKPVGARTVEAGLRRSWDKGDSASIALFRTVLRDELSFIASNGTNAGYFANVGSTIRQGLELNLERRRGPVQLNLGYAFIDARSASPLALPSPFNSSADASGVISVPAGSRLPNIPRHTLGMRMQYQPRSNASIGVGVVVKSSIFARGDENNRDVHGQVPGYAVINLDGRLALSRRFELLAQVRNLLDRKYASFATLGQNFFNGPGGSFSTSQVSNELFLGPGAPRFFSLALRWWSD